MADAMIVPQVGRRRVPSLVEAGCAQSNQLAGSCVDTEWDANGGVQTLRIPPRCLPWPETEKADRLLKFLDTGDIVPPTAKVSADIAFHSSGIMPFCLAGGSELIELLSQCVASCGIGRPRLLRGGGRHHPRKDQSDRQVLHRGFFHLCSCSVPHWPGPACALEGAELGTRLMLRQSARTGRSAAHPTDRARNSWRSKCVRGARGTGPRCAAHRKGR